MNKGETECGKLRGMFMFVRSLVSISDVPVVVEALFHFTELVTVEAMSLWPQAEVFGISFWLNDTGQYRSPVLQKAQNSALCDAFPQGVGGMKPWNVETYGAVVHTDSKSKALDLH